MRLLTERLLEIVCEASRTIPESMKQHGSGIDWRKMIDFGNLLRHAYHSTVAESVWTSCKIICHSSNRSPNARFANPANEPAPSHSHGRSRMKFSLRTCLPAAL